MVVLRNYILFPTNRITLAKLAEGEAMRGFVISTSDLFSIEIEEPGEMVEYTPQSMSQLGMAASASGLEASILYYAQTTCAQAGNQTPCIVVKLDVIGPASVYMVSKSSAQQTIWARGKIYKLCTR
ncbi:MAG: hypothetical protein ACP5MH_07240 [Thermoproteus sp.]